MALYLKPLPGRVLVEIRERYSNVATTEQKYDTKTSGICVNICYEPQSLRSLTKTTPNILGKMVYWQEYKDGQILERDGKKYTFIKIEDLDGFEDVQTN